MTSHAPFIYINKPRPFTAIDKSRPLYIVNNKPRPLTAIDKHLLLIGETIDMISRDVEYHHTIPVLYGYREEKLTADIDSSPEGQLRTDPMTGAPQGIALPK